MKEMEFQQSQKSKEALKEASQVSHFREKLQAMQIGLKHTCNLLLFNRLRLVIRIIL